VAIHFRFQPLASLYTLTAYLAGRLAVSINPLAPGILVSTILNLVLETDAYQKVRFTVKNQKQIQILRSVTGHFFHYKGGKGLGDGPGQRREIGDRQIKPTVHFHL